ncbi:hypothetical protein CGCS363_v014514 [Colletotrichum siamense]|uniref:uncharacterized protein n=1 Tax=Colletotrichum siamense TaxID=690259 RepID=UPI001872F48E|nr:uncharacterized protein CGCS363_v014514 [Colletotrichum siamense]KAF5485230.1 hypothetical protein CGCS363_v014514 [Colletotrichum siamense]
MAPLVMAKPGPSFRDATRVAICSDQEALVKIPFLEFHVGTNGIVIVNKKTPSLPLFTRPYKTDVTGNPTKTIARRASELLETYFAILDIAEQRGLKAAQQPIKAWGLALQYLHKKERWPPYSVTDEKMQLVMVAFADARNRYLNNGGAKQNVPLKSAFFKHLADQLDEFNERRSPPALPAKLETSKDASSSTAPLASADHSSRQSGPDNAAVSLFVSSPAPAPGNGPVASGPRPLQPDDGLAFSLFEELQKVKDELEETKGTNAELKKARQMDMETRLFWRERFTKRMVWRAVLPAMNELQELKGLPV